MLCELQIARAHSSAPWPPWLFPWRISEAASRCTVRSGAENRYIPPPRPRKRMVGPWDWQRLMVGWSGEGCEGGAESADELIKSIRRIEAPGIHSNIRSGLLSQILRRQKDA